MAYQHSAEAICGSPNVHWYNQDAAITERQRINQGIIIAERDLFEPLTEEEWYELRLEHGCPTTAQQQVELTEEEMIAIGKSAPSPQLEIVPGYVGQRVGGDVPKPGIVERLAGAMRGGLPTEAAQSQLSTDELQTKLAEAQSMSRTFRMLAVGAGVAAGLSLLVASTTWYLSKKKKRRRGRRR
jgi:hypothetical protein